MFGIPRATNCLGNIAAQRICHLRGLIMHNFICTWQNSNYLRYAHSAASYNGKIYVFGGYRRTTVTIRLAIAEVYDPSKDTWSAVTAMPNAWADMTTGSILPCHVSMSYSFLYAGPLPVFPNGEILIPGAHGREGSNYYLKYAFLCWNLQKKIINDGMICRYDAKNDKWTNAPTANRFGGKYCVLQGAF